MKFKSKKKSSTMKKKTRKFRGGSKVNMSGQSRRVVTIPPGTTEFICSNNLISRLSPLPNTLKKLDCGNNKITQLPSLPNGLKNLKCSNNLITELPEPLPITLLLTHQKL